MRRVSQSQGLADNTVIAKVNNEVWDLDRPLEADCSLQLLKFDDEEAQAVSVLSMSSLTVEVNVFLGDCV